LPNEFHFFLPGARGSLVEVETQVRTAQNPTYVTGEDGKHLLDKAVKIGKIRNGLSGAIRPLDSWERRTGYRELISSSGTMHPILLSILLGLTAAAANVFGGAIIVQKHWDRSYLKYFVALGAGFMLATAIVEIFPASLELSGKNAPLLVLGGYLIVHLFEHTVTPHFHFGEETHKDAFIYGHRGYSVLMGLIIHTFFDGIAIASGFIVSRWLGWIIFLAIFLHKIPEGFTIASVMLASGRSRGIAWGASVVLGASTLAGVLTMAVFRHQVSFGLPLSAGVTIYVAASDLMPEVNREPGGKMALVVFLGVGLLFLLDRFAHVH
jgi:zinc and cadmium transporter